MNCSIINLLKVTLKVIFFLQFILTTNGSKYINYIKKMLKILYFSYFFDYIIGIKKQ